MRPRFVLAVFFLLVLSTSLAQAQSNIVPWMSGNFLGNEFNVGWTSPNGQEFFSMDFNPAWSDFNWTTTCYDQWDCYSYATAEATGGSVSGALYNHFDTPNPTLIATFSGAVTGGSALQVQWTSYGGWYTWQNQYWYSYEGFWSNGFRTIGTAYSADGDDVYPFGSYTMTTTTPEPSGLVLLGTGLVPMLAILRRKLLRG